MSYRYMRLMVFFDLPMDTAKNRAAYAVFRKGLIRDGFIMLQESVYSKLALNRTSAEAIKAKVRKMCPRDGNVICLTVTEKQFAGMEHIAGESSKSVLSSTDRLVVL